MEEKTISLTIYEIKNLIDILDNANSFCITPEYDPTDLAIRNKLTKALE
jgi:hypothetical protein